MSLVHLVSLDPDASAEAAFPLRESARRDRFGAHTLTDDPGAAEVILFVRRLTHGLTARQLFGHPLIRQHRRRCYLYDPNDRVTALLPGIYPSVERRWYSPGRMRSGPYLTREDYPVFDEDHAGDARRFLFHFAGSYTSAPVRSALGRLDHPRGCCVDMYAEADRTSRHGNAEEKAAFRRRYAETMWASAFVLCPRGFGTSSMRLFEAMRAGRPPVIVSDEWVEPAGPAWERFSVRVREAEVDSIPARLEALEPEAGAMGRMARREWEEWYAPPVLFHRTVEDCLSIARTPRALPEPLASWAAWGQLLWPSHLRHWLRAAGGKQRIKDALLFKGWR